MSFGLMGSKDGFLWVGVANSFVFLFVLMKRGAACSSYHFELVMHAWYIIVCPT